MVYIDLLKEVDENWTIIEKARFLYDRICKIVSYDERFAYGKDPKIMEEIYYKNIDIRKDEDTRVVCHTINKIYFALLQELNIKAKIIYKKSKIERAIDAEDTALIFYDEEENPIFVNIVGDIENCKYGLRPAFFGIQKNLYEEAKNVKKVSSEELRKIDKKLKIIRYDYNDYVFKLISNEVKNTNNFLNFLKDKGIETENLTRDEILKNKLYYISQLIKFRDKTAGPDEMKKFYKYLFSASVLDKFESKKFETYEFIKYKEKEVEVLSVIEIKTNDEPIYYVYSEEERTYIQLFKDEVLEKTDGFKERKNKKMIIEKEKKQSYEGEEH